MRTYVIICILVCLLFLPDLRTAVNAKENLINIPLMPFTMKLPDGSAVHIDIKQDRLAVEIGEERRTPKAIVIHFFQPDCL